MLVKNEARVKLEARFAWRRINPKQHDALVSALKPHAGALVEFDKLGDMEAATFADDLLKTLGDSGWLIRLTISGSMGPQYGLVCTVNEDLPAGKALAVALKSLPTAQVTHNGNLPVVAHIIVGLNPPP